MSRRNGVWPESVYDITLRTLLVSTEIREPALGAFPNLVPWDCSGSCDVEGELQISGEVRTDGVRLGGFGAWCGFVGDGELISLTGPLVKPRRGRDEVVDIDGLPDRFFRVRIVDFACELDCGVPYSVSHPTSRKYCGAGGT